MAYFSPGFSPAQQDDLEDGLCVGSAGDPSSLLTTCEDTSGTMCLNLPSPVEERDAHTGECPAKGH